jgi:hypothetical protein
MKTRLNYKGAIAGAATFLIIGAFHPLVVSMEYHWGSGVWWIFLVAGIAAIAASLFIRQMLWAAICAVLGFTCLWSIGEIIEQKERVEKGWFPMNPDRAACYNIAPESKE